MIIRKILFLALAYAGWGTATYAQQSTAACIRQNIKSGSITDLDTLTGLLVAGMTGNDFYIVGESHHFLANNDFQFALLKRLHQQKVFNVASELPHATCFIFNKYLETGNDSLLSALKPAAGYSLLKKVRSLNNTLPEKEQIRYYGIDYLDRKYDYSNLVLSLKIIRAKVNSRQLPVDELIEAILKKDSLTREDIEDWNSSMSRLLRADPKTYKAYYGKYYYDLLLMSSNMVGYRSNRDKDIFRSFLVLYDNLKQSGQAIPRFLAFYGSGHLGNLCDKYLLDKSSPVCNRVAKINIQYFNCIGQGNAGTGDQYRDLGFEYLLSKKDFSEFVALCKTEDRSIKIITDPGCLKLKHGAAFNGIIIFNNYGDHKMTSWKFD
jgi:hypothetical protein